MEFLIKAAQLLMSLSILVVLHELGHFIPAKLFKTKVEKFYLFFDPWFSVVKKKIGGASLSEDLKRIEAVLKILGPYDQLAVDANGRFDLETAIEYGKALSNYNLFWYEEPGDPLDFELHKELFESEPSNLHNSLIDVLACFRCFYKMVHNEDIVNETTHKTFYNYYNEFYCNWLRFWWYSCCSSSKSKRA